MHKVRQPFNVNRLAQIAARAALKHVNLITGRIKENRVQLDYIRNELIAMGFTVPSSQTNFILVVPPDGCTGIVDKLLGAGIIVRGMKPFGLGEESFRVTVGNAVENKRFIEAIGKLV